MSATVTVFDHSLPLDPSAPGVTPQVVRTKTGVQWWTQDANHLHWELETLEPSLDVGVSSYTADGNHEWYYDTRSSEYTESTLQVLSPSVVRGPAVIQVGPTGAPSLAKWVADVGTWQNAAGHVAIVGYETMLGHNTAVIAYGEQLDYDDGHGTRYLTGVSKMWVDSENLFILRHETDNGRFVAQVDTLDLKASIPPQLLTFVPPAGSHSFDPSTAPTAAPSWSGMSVLLPSQLPSGVSSGPSEISMHPGFREVVVHYVADAPATRPDVFAIEEKLPSPGLSASVLATPRVVIQGLSMYRGTGPNRERTLTWEQDNILLQLSSTSLTYQELGAIAASVRVS